MAAVAELGLLDVVTTLPEQWSKFLLGQAETGMDYQVVSVTLRDGRVIQDVAIVHHSIVSEVRGHSEIPFDPADITQIEKSPKESGIFGAPTQEEIPPPSNQSIANGPITKTL